MEAQLTISDQVLILNLGAYKTPEQLARIISKPVELIKDQCASLANQFTKLPKVSKQAKNKNANKKGKIKRISHAEQKLIREKKKTEEEKQKREKQSLHIQEQARVKERGKRLARGKFKTRVLDLTGKVAVKLDAKTTVWVNPGTDIVKLKVQLKIK